MPVPQDIKLQVRVNGGPWVSHEDDPDGVTVAGDDVIEMRVDNDAGISSYLFQIYEYPEGFSLPAGWTQGSGAREFRSTSQLPASFTIPTSAALVGRWILRVVINNGERLEGGETRPAPDLIDTIGLDKPFASGLKDTPFFEGDEFDQLRQGGNAAMKNNWRILEGLVLSEGAGQNNIGENIGDGADVYSGMNGVALQLRGVKGDGDGGGGGRITVAVVDDNVVVSMDDSDLVTEEDLPDGSVDVVTHGYTFKDPTADADPGDAAFRFDNATIGSITRVYIDLTDGEGRTLTGLFDSIQLGNLRIVKATDPTVWVELSLTAATITASGYRKLVAEWSSGPGGFTNDDVCRLQFTRLRRVAVGGDIFDYLFDSGTGGGNPGTNEISFNATPSAATKAYVNSVSADAGDIDSYLLSVIGGTLTVSSAADPSIRRSYDITARTDQANHVEFDVVHKAGNGSFTAGEAVRVAFVRAATSAGSGGLDTATGYDGVHLQLSSGTLLGRRGTTTQNIFPLAAQLHDMSGAGAVNRLRAFPNAASAPWSGILAPGEFDTTKITITNFSTEFSILMQHDHASSDAENRFTCPGFADFLLGPGETCEAEYDTPTARWLVEAQSGAADGAATAVAGLFAALNPLFRTTFSVPFHGDDPDKGFQRLLWLESWKTWLRVGWEDTEGVVGEFHATRLAVPAELEPTVMAGGGWNASAEITGNNQVGPIFVAASQINSNTTRAIVASTSETATVHFYHRYSDDGGATWSTGASNTPESPTKVSGMVHTGTNLILGWETGEIEYSDNDGVTSWTVATPPNSESRRLPVHNEVGTVLFFRAGFGTEYAISDDHGETWAEGNFPDGIEVLGAAYTGGRFVVLGQDASDALLRTSSEDGVTWDPVAAPIFTGPTAAIAATLELHEGHADASQMVAVGDVLLAPFLVNESVPLAGNELYYSTNLAKTWSPTGTYHRGFGAADDNQVHLAAGPDRFALIDPNSRTWLSLAEPTNLVIAIGGSESAASTNPLRFTFDADFDSIGDPGAGNFGALDPDYSAPGSPDGWGAIYISQSNVAATNVELLLQKKSVLGGKLTIHDSTFTNWFTFDITHVFVHADYIVVEVDDATAEGQGSFADATEYEFSFDFAHLPPNASHLTGGSNNPNGTGTSTTFTPTYTSAVKGDVHFVVLVRNSTGALTLPAGQGWTEHNLTTWGPESGFRLSVLAKMCGMPGIVDDLTPTFTFAATTDYLFNGGILRGLYRTSGNTYQVTDSGAVAVSAQPYISTSLESVDAGGISLRAVVSDEPTLDLNQIGIVTDGKSFVTNGNQAFKFSETALTGMYRCALYLEGHASGGRVTTITIGPQTTGASAELAQITMSFRPKRS